MENKTSMNANKMNDFTSLLKGVCAPHLLHSHNNKVHPILDEDIKTNTEENAKNGKLNPITSATTTSADVSSKSEALVTHEGEYTVWHISFLNCEVSSYAHFSFKSAGSATLVVLASFLVKTDSITFLHFDSKWKIWLVVFMCGELYGYSNASHLSVLSRWAVLKNVSPKSSTLWHLRNDINMHFLILILSVIFGTVPFILYITSNSVYDSWYGAVFSIPLNACTISFISCIFGLLSNGFDLHEGVRKLFNLDAKHDDQICDAKHDDQRRAAKHDDQRRVVEVPTTLLDTVANDTSDVGLQSLQNEIELFTGFL
jgi:hypothetical protein